MYACMYVCIHIPTQPAPSMNFECHFQVPRLCRVFRPAGGPLNPQPYVTPKPLNRPAGGLVGCFPGALFVRC